MKCKSRRGRGHGSGDAGVDRLVALAIERSARIAGRAPDVRRERNLAHGLERGHEIACGVHEPDAPRLAVARDRNHRRDRETRRAACRVESTSTAAQQRVPPSAPANGARSRISTRPPVGFVPRNRAGRTFVSFRTSEVAAPQARRAGPRNRRCATAPVRRSSTSSRDASRDGAGSWAMSSAGSVEVEVRDLHLAATDLNTARLTLSSARSSAFSVSITIGRSRKRGSVRIDRNAVESRPCPSRCARAGPASTRDRPSSRSGGTRAGGRGPPRDRGRRSSRA